MNGDYLLDTSIIIRIFNNDITVVDKIKSSRNIFIPVIAIGELYFGANNSIQKENNIGKINILSQSLPILIVDTQTAKLYGYIKENLKRIGKPIPENDIWIASISLQHSLTLACRDNHFSFINDLKYEMW
jgi:tRNA(fMet)-specific endonuclease VapC